MISAHKRIFDDERHTYLSFKNAIRENKLSDFALINAVYNNKKIYFGPKIKSKVRMYGIHLIF